MRWESCYGKESKRLNFSMNKKTKARLIRAFVLKKASVHLPAVLCKNTIGVDNQTRKIEKTDNGKYRAFLFS